MGVEDEPVSVQGDEGDAGTGEEHCHALDAAYRLAQPGLHAALVR